MMQMFSDTQRKASHEPTAAPQGGSRSVGGAVFYEPQEKSIGFWQASNGINKI